MKHRVRRLPDTPEKISRGVWAGVFASFTPLFGLHFVLAALIAKLMRGNIMAALMGTFFGNPLTYIPIAYSALSTGHLLLGRRLDQSLIEGSDKGGACGIGCQFSRAFEDLWHNFLAIFTDDKMHWQGLRTFFDDVFYPYLIGGIIPGVGIATICYFISVPLIRAYQNRRRKRLRAKLAQLKIPPNGPGA